MLTRKDVACIPGLSAKNPAPGGRGGKLKGLPFPGAKPAAQDAKGRPPWLQKKVKGQG